MTFPLNIFLFIHFAFLAVWFIFCLVAIYHMFKFGFRNFITFFTTFIFIAITALMLITSYNYISQIDWQINITILKDLFNNQPNF